MLNLKEKKRTLPFNKIIIIIYRGSHSCGQRPTLLHVVIRHQSIMISIMMMMTG
jgi:hypothetical protein